MYSQSCDRDAGQECRAVHQGENQHHRDRMALLLGQDRRVAVQFGLVERPDQLLRGLANRSLVLITLVRVFSRSAASVNGSVRPEPPPFYFLPRFAFFALLVFLLAGGLLVDARDAALQAAQCPLAQSTVECHPAWHPGRPDAFRCWSLRPAIETTSARDGIASCSSVLSMAFSTASRKGAETVR